MIETTTQDLARPSISAPDGLVRLGREFAYLVAGLPLGVLTFTVAVTGLALALGLAITLLGIPVLLATLVAARWFGRLERRRAGWVLGRPIAEPGRRWSGGLWARTRAAVTDPAAWRDLGWSLLLLPLGIAGFTVAVTAWTTALGLLTSPAWYWALPEGEADTIALLDSADPEWAALRVVAGGLLLVVAALVCRGLALGTAHLARISIGDR